MSRPGWARECTCGNTPFSYFCQACDAWAGASYGDQQRHTTPQADAPAPVIQYDASVESSEGTILIEHKTLADMAAQVAVARGITIAEARELLAKGQSYKPKPPTGTGH